MRHLTHLSPEEIIFVLDCIEFSAIMLRGPDRDSREGLILQGVPGLAEAAEAESTGLAAPLRDLAAMVSSSVSDPSSASAWLESLVQQHLQLFVTARGGVPAPPYASCHLPGDSRVMGPSALAMRDRLQRAGLEVQGQGREPEDHIATQLEYLYFLLHTAMVRGETPPEDPSAFAEEALLPWTETFANAVARADEHGFFSGVARLAACLTKLVGRGAHSGSPS